MMRAPWSRVIILAALAVLYGFTRLPSEPDDERQSLAARFHFTRSVLPAPVLGEPRHVHEVHPSFYRHASWVSAIGSSVSLADVDGDGLPNDLCHVDPRYDRVLVAPVPGTGPRYAGFALEAAPLPYDQRTMAPTGCMVGDFDEDGGTDLLVFYWGRTPILFLRQPGAAAPTMTAPTMAAFRRVELVPAGGLWNTTVGVQADLDGDGHLDLAFGNYFQDGARVLDARATGKEEMQDSMSRAYNGGSKPIFLWTSTADAARAPFRQVTGLFDAQIEHGWILAAGAADIDGDLLPELFFGNDFGPDRLLYNQSQQGKLRFANLVGRKTLTVPSSKVLGRDSYKGMGVDFGDIDGDGRIDIYVSNIANEFALEESHFAFINTGDLAAIRRGVAPFVDRSEDLGLSRSAFSWEARLADFDNDGQLETMQATGFIKGQVRRWAELQELAMINDQLLRNPSSWPRFRPGDDVSGHHHNPFFVRTKSGRFIDLAPEIGLGEPMVSRGIATADVDGDGDLDFAVANQWEDSYFYTNESANPGAFLGLRLRLPLAPPPTALAPPATPATVATGSAPAQAFPSRPAIGATAIVHLPGGRRLIGQVDGGSGHSGDRSPEIHFGLGRIAPATPLRVDLRWRDGGGAVRTKTMQLTSGWHTVLLGADGKEG
jgi:enediyne biosynthesis protein E4